jgi:arsenate reductase
MEYWHNPRCRKSREGLALLAEHGVQPKLRLYLEDPPTAAELQRLVRRLGIDPEALVRKGEAVYKERYRGHALTGEDWIRAMAEHPKLIERPVFIDGDRAVIGRPPERLLDLL